MAQTGGGAIECRLPIGERADAAGSSSSPFVYRHFIKLKAAMLGSRARCVNLLGRNHRRPQQGRETKVVSRLIYSFDIGPVTKQNHVYGEQDNF